jgi:hypothetical protein
MNVAGIRGPGGPHGGALVVAVISCLEGGNSLAKGRSAVKPDAINRAATGNRDAVDLDPVRRRRHRRPRRAGVLPVDALR